eukprot:TRINITY_DN3163_c2_g2_i1.p1 TRINITY_DN3163_c2_g2~~TRINITY_DN3163_c2_g2_i1.p1  ORF type:complete len:1132 (+),score=374.61 TRINITY_DN3163_c2_g2_i1:140-3397(+)
MSVYAPVHEGRSQSPSPEKGWFSASVAAIKKKLKIGDEEADEPPAEEAAGALNGQFIKSRRRSPTARDVGRAVLRTKPRETDGWWDHVEICRDSVKYTDVKVILALQHGLRRTLAEPSLSSDDVEECLVSALFLYMIGSDNLDFVFMHSLALTALKDVTPRRRRLAYLVCGLCLKPEDDRRLLLVNSLSKDLATKDPAMVAAALAAAGKVLDKDLFPTVLNSVVPLMASRHAIVKKKAVEAVHACHRVCGEDMFAALGSTPEEVFEATLQQLSGNCMLPPLALCASLLPALPAPCPEPLLERVANLFEDLVEGIGVFGGLGGAQPSVFVQLAVQKLLRGLLAFATPAAVAKHAPATCTALHRLLRKTKGYLQTTRLDTLPALPLMGVLMEVCRCATVPALLPFVRGGDGAGLVETLSDAVDILFEEEKPNNRYIALRCLGFLSLVDNQEGFNRQEHVIDAVGSADPALLLGGVDVMCGVAREGNVRNVLLKLLSLAQRLPRIRNFAVLLGLKASLVQRAHLLSWDVARGKFPLLHLHTSLRLLTEHPVLPSVSVEQHSLQLFGWLHTELALRLGETVPGHGDLELCGDDDDDGDGEDKDGVIDANTLERLQTLRSSVCSTMSHILRTRAATQLPVIARDDGLGHTTDTEPISTRLAAWCIGEYGAWYGPHSLAEHVYTFADALADVTPRSSSIATVGMLLSLSKMIIIYGHLRLTGQPAVINGRDTSLSADAIEAVRAALAGVEKARDVTVAGAAAEARQLLDMVLDLLRQSAGDDDPAAAARVQAGADIVGELALPHCTYIQQEVDVKLSCLDGFVAAWAAAQEQSGAPVRRYLSRSERRERKERSPERGGGLGSPVSPRSQRSSPARGGFDAAEDPELVLNEPAVAGPWGQMWGGAMLEEPEAEAADEESPATPSTAGDAGAAPEGKRRGKDKKRKRKKAHVWLEAALDLAGGAGKAKAKVAEKAEDKVAASRAASVPSSAAGLTQRWGERLAAEQIYSKLPRNLNGLKPAEAAAAPAADEEDSPTKMLVVKNSYWGRASIDSEDDMHDDAVAEPGQHLAWSGAGVAQEGPAGREALVHKWGQ